MIHATIQDSSEPIKSHSSQFFPYISVEKIMKIYYRLFLILTFHGLVASLCVKPSYSDMNGREVYYEGQNCVSNRLPSENITFTDSNGNYQVEEGEHLDFRYEILEAQHPSEGISGKVYSGYDHKDKKKVAIKIIKSTVNARNMVRDEVRILKYITQMDPDDKYPFLKIEYETNYRNHQWIVLPRLSVELLYFIKDSPSSDHDIDGGLIPSQVQNAGLQILNALDGLARIGVVHADLKPENIMLTPDIKHGILKTIIIDFGVSFFANESEALIGQSFGTLSFMAPELLFQSELGQPIDMWSYGCVLYELLTGSPLILGKSRREILEDMIDLLGVPPEGVSIKNRDAQDVVAAFIIESRLSGVPSDSIIAGANDELEKRLRKDKPNLSLESNFTKQFLDLLRKCLKWNPKERITAEEALMHPFFRA